TGSMPQPTWIITSTGRLKSKCACRCLLLCRRQESTYKYKKCIPPIACSLYDRHATCAQGRKISLRAETIVLLFRHPNTLIPSHKLDQILQTVCKRTQEHSRRGGGQARDDGGKDRSTSRCV